MFNLFAVYSCKKDPRENERVYTNNNIVLSGAQEVPPVTTAASGKMEATYSTFTKILSYTITWQNLTDTVTAMHIHGFADPGFAAPPIQNLITPSNGIARPNANVYGKSGSFSGSLFIDEVVIKEDNLIAGKTYINIHTSKFPGGEIRGQITFQQ
jgi:hypothetical protein